jgi:predicted nucleic acid-binding protein
MRFFDTNVLVYAIDRTDPQRMAVARDLVREAMQAQSLVISTQVMLEFYAVTQRRQLASAESATALLREWAEGAISTTPDLLWRAFEIQQKLQFSLWDAAIVQAALDAGCDVLYTEDLQAGQHIGPLEVVNPFAKALRVHEPRAEYVVAPQPQVAAQVDKLLRRAIARKQLVSLVYDGLRRVGEPHDYAVKNGKVQLNFFQTGGQSKSGKLRSWRTLDADQISDVEVLDRPFTGTRETPTGSHRKWDEVLASVTLQPTRKRR